MKREKKKHHTDDTKQKWQAFKNERKKEIVKVIFIVLGVQVSSL